MIPKPRRVRGAARPTQPRARRAAALATRRARILPSFLVIGAQRAGTTTFFSDLCQHAHVARPVGKELNFFNRDYWRGIDWYRSFFPTAASRRLARLRGGDLVAGEATPYYLFHPAVPSRVAETLPDAKLIVLLRNPVDRAYSHYQKIRRMGFERLSFEEALDAEEKRLAGAEERLAVDPRNRNKHHRRHAYLARGHYADQLERWYAHFPRDQILVLLAEDYFARAEETHALTLDFLGLPRQELTRQHHYKPPPYEPLAPALRASLEQRFARSNARLSLLLGREVWPRTQVPLRQAQSSASSSA